MLLIEFSPYHMSRMKADPEVFIEVVAEFTQVDVFEGEDETTHRSLSGRDLAEYLRSYDRQYRAVPYGRYLNLIAQR